MSRTSTRNDFRFSVGLWNLHAGADPFGPTVRTDREMADKLAHFKEIGFDFIQLHDDDAVPDEYSFAQRESAARDFKKILDDNGLQAEFVAPRLWEDARGIDGPIPATTLPTAPGRSNAASAPLMWLTSSKPIVSCGGQRAKAPTFAKAKTQSVHLNTCSHGRTRCWTTTKTSKSSKSWAK